jgi:hypothetical protein
MLGEIGISEMVKKGIPKENCVRNLSGLFGNPARTLQAFD